jgi:hypothetical protein
MPSPETSKEVIFIICAFVVSKLSPTIAEGTTAAMAARKLASGIYTICAFAFSVVALK